MSQLMRLDIACWSDIILPELLRPVLHIQLQENQATVVVVIKGDQFPAVIWEGLCPSVVQAFDASLMTVDVPFLLTQRGEKTDLIC